MLQIIDISHWQPTIDPARLLDAGIVAIIHKATQGTKFTDGAYEQHRNQWQPANLWGAYHFLDPGDGAAQADHFLDFVQPEGKTLLALDFESGTVAQAEAFVQRVRERYGIWPLLYTRAEYISSQIGSKPTLLANCSLWVADPNGRDKPILPRQWATWAIWQYAIASVNGIDGQNVDRDGWAGAADELVTFWKALSPKESFVPQPNYVQRNVIAQVLNVRSAPTINDLNIIGHVVYGTLLWADLSSLSNGFVRIRNGAQTGWVFAAYLAVPFVTMPQPTVLLDVPYRGQWEVSASHYRNDCLPACIGMLLDKVAKDKGLTFPQVSTDTLSGETTLASADIGLYIGQGVNLADRNGLSLLQRNTATPDVIKSELQNGRPVLVLIGYAAISERQDLGDTGLHFVVVTGFDADRFYVNDPDRWDSSTHKTSEGHNFPVPAAELDRALQIPSPQYQGLFLATSKTPAPAPPPVVIPPAPKQATGYGPHCLQGSWNDELSKYPVIKVLDDNQALQRAHAANPAALCIYRHYDHDLENLPQYIAQSGGVQAAVQRWMDSVQGSLGALPFAIFEGPNEQDPTDELIAFELERTKMLIAAQRKACVLNLGTGRWDVGLWSKPAAQELIRLVQSSAGVLGLHAYGEGIISASCGDHYWREDGSWSVPGDPLPKTISAGNNWQAMHLFDDKLQLAALGLRPIIVATEGGCDDNTSADYGKNGVYYPHGVKTRGWRSCAGPWHTEGWLNGTDQNAFMLRTCKWYCDMLGILLCIYAHKDQTPWGSIPGVFDTIGLL